MSAIIAPLTPSTGVSDPLTIGSVFATSTIRNANSEQIISGTKPTTRVNGSALVAGDRWVSNTINAYWNGTLWLTIPERLVSAQTFLSSTNVFAISLSVPMLYPSITVNTEFTAFANFFLHRASLVYNQVSGTWNGSNKYDFTFRELRPDGAGTTLSTTSVDSFVNGNARYFPFSAVNTASSTIGQTGYAIGATRVGAPPSMNIFLSLELSWIL